MREVLNFRRREFVKIGAGATGAALASITLPPTLSVRALAQAVETVDATIRIAPTSVEIGPGAVVRTTAYNGACARAVPTP